jgi:tetratricopeptide (TPR) repeat protein
MASQCNYCGVKSELDGLFHKSESSSGGQSKTICPKCFAKIQAEGRKRGISSTIFVGTIGLLILLLSPDQSLGWVFVNMMAFQITAMLCVLAHELGHVAAARIIGWRPFQIIIGSGKTICQKDFWRINVIIKLFPGGGLAIAAPPKECKYSRFKHGFFILAGPMVNLSMLLLAVLWIFRGSDRVTTAFYFEGFFGPLTYQLALAQLFVFSNLLQLISGLWPRRVMTEAGKIPNDGLALINLTKTSAAHTKKLYASYYFLEAMRFQRHKNFSEAQKSCEAGLREFPAEEHLANLLGTLLLQARRYLDARDCFLRLLPNIAQSGTLRVVLLNNIAYADAMIGDSSLLDEADQYSKEALEKIPWIPAFNGTRGTVLVAKGQVDDGIEFLKKAFQDDVDTASKATNACHLAVAEKMRGNPTESALYLKVAKDLDPHCPLLKLAAES